MYGVTRFAPRLMIVALLVPYVVVIPIRLVAQFTSPARAASTSGSLGSTDGDIEGVHVELLELKRSSGNTVTVKLAVTNNSPRDLPYGASMQDAGAGGELGSVDGIHLIDAGNKKKYFVVRDSDQKCLCSRNVEIKPGARVLLYAKFPAPPETVKKVTVEIPHFLPIDDVPIGS